MRLEIASAEAVRHACLHFHYSRRVPSNLCGFSVFNGKGEWCGVIIYSNGATPQVAKSFRMAQGMICELSRVALNGKQESTSQAISISLRMLKRLCPLIELVVSFADRAQGHVGTVYQASNWLYLGTSQRAKYYLIRGKKTHPRSVVPASPTNTLAGVRKYIDPNAVEFFDFGKYKYVYPLTEKQRRRFKSLAMSYPKRDQSMTVMRPVSNG